MSTANYNLLTQTRWVALIPAKLIDETADDFNIAMNLTNCNLPPMIQAHNKVSFNGFEVPVPASVDKTPKVMKFNYLLDSTLSQYKFLRKWKLKQTNDVGAGTDNKLSDMTIPIRVVLLTEFKNPVVEFVFNNCTLSSVDGLPLRFNTNTDDPLTHGFTVEYSKLTIEE
jgi:hypothetical protein